MESVTLSLLSFFLHVLNNTEKLPLHPLTLLAIQKGK